jgi:hypothetical protein
MQRGTGFFSLGDGNSPNFPLRSPEWGDTCGVRKPRKISQALKLTTNRFRAGFHED